MNATGAALALTLAWVGAQGAESRPAAWPPGALAALESAAVKLARAGRQEEAGECAGVQARLGLNPAAIAQLRAQIAREIGKGKPNLAMLGEAATQLRNAVRGLGSKLGEFQDPFRSSAASAILQLDSECEAAHLALGHERQAGRWRSTEDLRTLKFRVECEKSLRAAHELQLSIEAEESRHPLLLAVYGVPGSVARWKGIEVHSRFSRTRAARMLEEALRGAAFAEYLRSGKLAPARERATPIVLVDTAKAFEAAVDDALAAGVVDRQGAERAKQLTWMEDRRGWALRRAASEQLGRMLLFCDFAQDFDHTAWLEAGRLSWTARNYFGAELPMFSWIDEANYLKLPNHRTTTRSPEDEKELQEILRFTRAGATGGRRWMRELAVRGEDPPLESSFVKLFGEVGGNDRLKCTYVFEYLMELGIHQTLLRDTREALGVNLKRTRKEILEGQIRESLDRFEARWRAWIIASDGGILQRLDRAAAKPSELQQSMADELNSIRQKAYDACEMRGEPKVEIDLELSEFASLHAQYLARHRAQALEWPAAHEEYPERDGYTPEGAWSAAHSIIAAEAPNARDALGQWLSSFYHRIPLLRPGLLRIGVAIERGISVMDVESMREERNSEFEVLWPYPGQKGVPTRMADELPRPVPSASPGTLGYPITLTVGFGDRFATPERIELALYDAPGSTQKVDCWESTPDDPLNEKLVPPDTWCLIPKAPLRNGVTYRVIATWRPSGKSRTWTFQTK
ncbi:MAG: CAP domain-containing protein [Planctomycetes bacterium]|nr:CAP domain-containing protein [Planctomycetota bacterium]